MAKLQWNKSNKEFRDTMGNFAVAVWELEDKKAIFSQNLKKRNNCLSTDLEDLEKFEKGEKSGLLRTKSEIESSISSNTRIIEKMKQEESALEKEIKERMEKAYSLVPETLYNAYNNRLEDSDGYNSAISAFLESNGVTPTNAGIAVLRDTCGDKEIHGKKVVKNASTMGLVSHKKDVFSRLFLKGVAREMVNANCIKTDAYTFEFKEEKNK